MTSPEKIRVAICTPCQDTVAAGYALDLAKLMGHTTLVRGDDLDLVLLQLKGTIIPQQRVSLTKYAMEARATHILWLDADMRFPKDALLRLLAHEQPIVAANYPTRRPPILPTAEDRTQGRLFTLPESTGLVPVSHAGMGLMLTQMRVFDAMAKPWFTLGYSKDADGFVGEDVYFCRKAADLGFPTLIDQELSKEVRHVGEMAFSMDHACQTRSVLMARETTQDDAPPPPLLVRS